MDLLKKAIKEVSHLKSGEIFLLKELFKGYEWKRIDKPTRLRLGVLFLNEVNNNEQLNVKVIEKTTSNQQRYQKI